MKKRLKITLLIIGILILTIVILFMTLKNNTGYKIITNSYTNYESKIISDYQEYLSFVDFVDSENKNYGKKYKFNPNKYNEEYFITKSLAIINVVTGTGMNKIKNINISFKDTKLICGVEMNFTTSQITTNDIKGKLILVEIDKSITEFEIMEIK